MCVCVSSWSTPVYARFFSFSLLPLLLRRFRLASLTLCLRLKLKQGKCRQGVEAVLGSDSDSQTWTKESFLLLERREEKEGRERGRAG